MEDKKLINTMEAQIVKESASVLTNIANNRFVIKGTEQWFNILQIYNSCENLLHSKGGSINVRQDN